MAVVIRAAAVLLPHQRVQKQVVVVVAVVQRAAVVLPQQRVHQKQVAVARLALAVPSRVAVPASLKRSVSRAVVWASSRCAGGAMLRGFVTRLASGQLGPVTVLCVHPRMHQGNDVVHAAL